MIEIPADPLGRFCDIYRALNAERSWGQEAAPLRFASVAALSCDGGPEQVAAGIRAKDRELCEALGWLSSFYGQFRMVLAAVLLLHNDFAADFLAELKRVRPLFRRARLPRNKTYELMAVLILRTRNEKRWIDQTKVDQLKEIFDGMKSYHPLLTAPDDFPAAALLCDRPGLAVEIGRRVEDIYQALRQTGQGAGNLLQTAANVLCLARGTAEELAGRFRNLQKSFRKAGLKMVRNDYDELAILSFFHQAAERVVEQVLDHRRVIRELRPRPSRQMSFSLAASTAYLELARLDGEAEDLTGIKALLDMHAVIQAQGTATAAAVG